MLEGLQFWKYGKKDWRRPPENSEPAEKNVNYHQSNNKKDQNSFHSLKNNAEQEGGQFDDVDNEPLTDNLSSKISPSDSDVDQGLKRSQSNYNSVSSGSTVKSPSIPNVSYEPKYSDSNSMQINEWLSLIEMDFKHLRTDELKIQTLKFYLENDALMWYTKEIVEKCNSMTWQECKEQMTIRFTPKEVRPIIAAIDRLYRENETLLKYYTDKMWFLNQNFMPDIDKVALLSDGMPYNLRMMLTAANLQTPEKWLVLASQLESTLFNHLESSTSTINIEEID